jgi:type III restriction enzyme
MRVPQIATHLSKHVIEKHLSDGHSSPPYHLYYAVQPIVRRWIAECLELRAGARPGMLTYAVIGARAAALIAAGIRRGSGGDERVMALLDPFNPAVATDHVQFITSKTKLYATTRSHVNFVVGDSDWEIAFAEILERHPATIAYVKNQGLGFEVPYLEASVQRMYRPDFVVLVDDGRGRDDPLNLVVEIKGERDTTDQIKAETMRSLWVPGVNNLGTCGRWAFVELADKYGLEADYGAALGALFGAAKETA